ncbi:MAG: carboxypeptidase-like regulatory domain-containing protein, partial [Terracidiphilus sp.]
MISVLKPARPTLWIAVLVLGLTALCTAQTFRGGINGTVTDTSGAVLANIPVLATAEATGVNYRTVTSAAGEFQFQDLPLGVYSVTVTAAGFQSVKVDHIPVTAGIMYTLPLKVSPAQATTTVEVTANQLTPDTTSATLEVAIPEEAVQDIPQNGRDYTQLVAQSPGYAGYNSLGGGGYASVNGTRVNSINWQLEGTDNNDIWWDLSAINISGASGIAGSLIPVDAIDEFS